ncbi:uncharacterized protein LOC120331141 [Styela clava]
MDVTNPLQVPPPQDRNKMDLQKMLIDERIRCDTHKTNYQVLKEQHKLLQEENVKLQQQVTRYKTTGAESAEGLQSIINDLRGQLASKERELETVRGQALNPQRLEVIKAEITKELEGPLKDHVEAMDKEVEKYRGEYNKLRYEHAFLKSEYDHLKVDHKRILEELSLRHQAQISALQEERDEARKAYDDRPMPDVNDTRKIQTLQRTKTQIELRVKNLLDEINEIQKQKEYSATESDKIQRSQAQDIAQLQGNLKSVESERRSIESKCERLQRELQSNSEHNTRLTQQLQEKEKECSAFKNMMDEESHKHKVELSNIKLKEMKIQGDLEREKDALNNRVRTLETELDVARHMEGEHNKHTEELERDAVRRVQEAKQEEWNKNHALQTEKIALEERVRELERRVSDEQSSKQNEREQAEERLKILEANEASAQSEAAVLRSKIDSLSKASAELEKERESNATMRQRLHDKELELQTALSGRQQLLSEMQRLKEESKNCRKMVEDARLQTEKAQQNGERVVEDQRLAGMEERHRLQGRIDQLEHKLSRLSESSEKSTKRLKKTQQLLINKIKSLKNRSQLLEAEKEHLEIEMKAGKHGVPLEEYNRMRRRLNDYQRKHNEFARTLGLSEFDKMVFHNSTSAHYNTVVMPLSSTQNGNKGGSMLQDSGERGISQIWERLDFIEKQQKIQDIELENVAKPAQIRTTSDMPTGDRPSRKLKLTTHTVDDGMKLTPQSEHSENRDRPQTAGSDRDHDHYSSSSFESDSKSG